MHAADLTRELNIPRALIPINPGVLSAVGLSTTDIQYDYINTEFSLLADVEQSDLQDTYADLLDQARDQLRSDGVPRDRMALEMTADCRYEGQGYELNIPVGASGDLDNVETIRQRFHDVHEAEFGHSFPENPVEIVNERVTGYGELPSSDLVSMPEATEPVDSHVLAEEEVHFRVDGETAVHETPFFERSSLRAGHQIQGPAIVGEKDSTIVIPPDFTANVLDYGDIELVHTE
jgi:N-methylhydantoinase A